MSQPSTAREALIAIAELLAPGEPAVANHATSAHDDPEGYVREHADRLDGRGIDEPEPNLAWIALIDALTDHGLLAEMDWKEEDSSIVHFLKALRSSPGPDAWAWWPERAGNELDTYEFLQLTGDKLRESGTTLAVLDIESDCYPLVLVPTARVPELADLAKTAGFPVWTLASAA